MEKKIRYVELYISEVFLYFLSSELFSILSYVKLIFGNSYFIIWYSLVLGI